MDNLNTSLHALYSSKWNSLQEAMRPVLHNPDNKIKPTSPLLLKVGNEAEYQNADIRLVIFGQETNSWYEEFHGDMQEVIGCYDGFFNDKECWGYGGQFWNGFARFLKLLNERYPDKSVAYLWNNIVKIGKHGAMGLPPSYILEVEQSNFDVIPQELAILQPTITLFLTGPNYDPIINSLFNKPTFSTVSDGFSTRQLAQLAIPNSEYTFRTYHPGYLWRNNLNHYFKNIIDQLKFE
jgi:hypothetical protein